MKRTATTPTRLLAAGICSVVLAAGCSRESAAPSAVDEATVSDALAWVNDTPVTDADIDRALRKTLGRDVLSGDALPDRKMALESLIISRAIAQRSAQDLSGEEQRDLQGELQDFKEQWLVKRYLKHHARPPALTEAQIETYYNEHPEQFGGGEVTTYELLSPGAKVAEPSRSRVLGLLDAARQQADWAQYAQQIRGTGQAMRYSREVHRAGGTLDARLVQVLAQLQPGQVSATTYIDGLPYKIRAVSREQMTPQPLQKVRAQVRRALLPGQIKQAIDAASQQVMRDTEVRYAADRDNLAAAQ